MSPPERWPAPRAEGIGLWLVLATAIISGVSTFANAYAVAGTSSDAFVTLRNAVTALLVAPFALLVARSSGERLRRADWGRLAAIGLIGGAIPFLLFFRGLQLATASGGGLTASFLYRTLFLWATVLGVLVLRERVHLRVAVAAGLLLGGNLLLMSLSAPVWTDGSLYVLAATGLWAGEYTLSKRSLQLLRGPTVALGRMGFGALFLLGYLALSGEVGAAFRFTEPQWAWVGLSAVLLAAFVATFYAGLQRVDLGVATAVLVLGFPVTLVLSALIRGTATPAVPAVGAAAVVAGAILVAGRDRWRAAWRVLREEIPRAPAAA